MEYDRHVSPWTLIGIGVFQMLFGAFAILVPFAVGTAVVWVVGALLLAAGALQVGDAVRGRRWRMGAGEAFEGLLYVVFGLLLVLQPVIGFGIVGFLLACLFLARGVWRMTLGWGMRPRAGWGWLFTGGLLALFLAGLILSDWPLSGAWAVGVLVGFELLWSGSAHVMLGSALKAAVEAEESGGGAE